YKQEKPGISKLANATVASVIAQYFCFFTVIMIAEMFPSEARHSLSYKLYESVALFFFISPIILTPVLGITAFVKIVRSKGLLAGKGRVIFAMVMWLFITIIIINPALSALQ
ncbi:hypothetical protein LCGC14_2771380, partial [marine sediment metagenome]